MNDPIVIAAFGTTSRALATYEHLDQELRRELPGRAIHWTYTSRTISRTLQEKQDSRITTPDELFRELHHSGVQRATVQSLHLLPGKEFHALTADVRKAPFPCRLGLPILSSPQDYEQLAIMLAPAIDSRPEAAILILGHGTYHPSWTCYPALENILRKRWGDRIFVGALEQYPESAHLPATIRSAGFTKVCIIPFLLVAGMHFQRDISGEKETCWEKRLEAEKIEMEICGEGLGRLPGLAQLIVAHIGAAEET